MKGVTKADLGLMVVAVVWGINLSVVKQTISEMLPMSFTAARFSVASLLLVLGLVITEGGFLLNRRDLKQILFLGLLGHASYQVMFINGIDRTNASVAALIMATNPIFVLLIDSIALRRRPSLRVAAGMCLSLAGVTAIMATSPGGQGASDFLLGNLLVLFGSICWAVYTALSRSILKRYSPLRLTATTMALGTIFIDAAAIPSFLAQDWHAISATGWAGFLYSLGLALVLSYLLWSFGVQRIGPDRTAVYQNLIPVVAMLAAVLMLGERMTLTQLAGSLFVLVGIYVTRKA